VQDVLPLPQGFRRGHLIYNHEYPYLLFRTRRFRIVPKNEKANVQDPRQKKMIRDMEKVMSSKRGLNNLHRYLLMQADMMTCSSSNSGKTQDTVKASFDKAITMAGKAGFRQDAALGNELAGEYLFTGMIEGNMFWAEFYFSRAYDLYMEWGAEAKAGQLKAKRGDLINESIGNRLASTTSSTPVWRSYQFSSLTRSTNRQESLRS
jgi:hypothetical protein